MGKANENSVRTSVLFDENGKKIASAKLFLFNMDDDGHSVFVSLIAPPSTAKPGKALVKIEAGNSVLMQTPLEIVKKDFISEIIPLNPSNTTLRTKPDPKKTEEAEKLWSILKTSGNDIWGSAAFVPPVAAETRRSSFFGDRRVYKYSDGKSDTSVHAGIDYAVPKNTPVKACAAGKVILARPRIVTGNSIIIEHIPAVYSIYYHLEKIQVEENSIVKAGDVIGLSGSTGLSTGPHLHWEIRVSTENADPDTFCARAPLDRAAIFKAIFD
jgi:murein DD-endopeptidase MepM/ murein hydrolase activator NlpD